MVLVWHTKDTNSANLLLKIKWFKLKWPVLFSFYIGPFYLNVVLWLKKVPADTPTLLILKLLYFFTFKTYKYI